MNICFVESLTFVGTHKLWEHLVVQNPQNMLEIFHRLLDDVWPIPRRPGPSSSVFNSRLFLLSFCLVPHLHDFFVSRWATVLNRAIKPSDSGHFVSSCHAVDMASQGA